MVPEHLIRSQILSTSGKFVLFVHIEQTQDWAKRKIVVLSDRYNARSLPNEMKICGMRRKISYAGKFLIKNGRIDLAKYEMPYLRVNLFCAYEINAIVAV